MAAPHAPKRLLALASPHLACDWPNGTRPVRDWLPGHLALSGVGGALCDWSAALLEAAVLTNQPGDFGRALRPQPDDLGLFGCAGHLEVDEEVTGLGLDPARGEYFAERELAPRLLPTTCTLLFKV